jgi:selenide,water dikinase
VTEADQLLMADAQTSGGLLLAVPPDRLEAVLTGLEAEGALARAVIGEVTDARDTIQVAKAD